MARWSSKQREEFRKTRTRTERLVERLLRQHYPELEFETIPEIAGFWPDFVFWKQGMILEVDGEVHDDHDAVHRDWRKDQRLDEAGWKVFRLRNADIWNDPEAAAHVIGSTLGIVRESVNQAAMWRRYSRRRPRGQRA